MNYEMWLSFNNREEVLRLPVTPFFKIKTKQGVTTVTLQKLGEISLGGLRHLKSVSLSSFFPHVGANYSGLQYNDYPAPWDCVALIEKWKESQRPIRLIITGTNVNMAMLIESFDYGLNDKTDDVEWSLNLIEYIFLEKKRLANDKGTTSENAESGSHSGDTEWKVRYGDTLTGIAKAVYGDSSKWKAIYEANKNLITNQNSLKNIEGQTLKLPSAYDMREPVTTKNAKYEGHLIPEKWKIKAGDTLTGIAANFYNNSALWEFIWKANKDIIKNPYSLKGIAGQEIKLPVYSENTSVVEE